MEYSQSKVQGKMRMMASRVHRSGRTFLRMELNHFYCQDVSGGAYTHILQSLPLVLPFTQSFSSQHQMGFYQSHQFPSSCQINDNIFFYFYWSLTSMLTIYYSFTLNTFFYSCWLFFIFLPVFLFLDWTSKCENCPGLHSSFSLSSFYSLGFK